MEKESEVDANGRVWWGQKRLTDDQLKELLQGFTADEKARARFMHVFSNRLTIVPREVLELKGLKVLNLTNNCLSSLPSFIGQLTSLEGLLLSGNELETMLASMTNLQQLNWYVNPRFSCFFSAYSLVFAG